MFMNVKYVLIMLVTVVMMCGLYICFRPVTDKRASFVVGMMSGWAPFMTINQVGEFEGFDIDVAKSIANKLGKKLEVRDFGSLSTLLVALRQNKVDCIMSGLDITKNRLQVMEMIPYTGESVKSLYLLFWNIIPNVVHSLSDVQKINDAVICVEPGSAQAKYLDQYKSIAQKPLSKIEDMILDIKYGKSLAALVEPHVASLFMRKVPELKKLEIPISQDFQTYGMGIAFVKDNPLSRKVKAIIQDMRQNRELETLENKWGLSEKRQQ